jgi:hypothetical protein
LSHHASLARQYLQTFVAQADAFQAVTAMVVGTSAQTIAVVLAQFAEELLPEVAAEGAQVAVEFSPSGHLAQFGIRPNKTAMTPPTNV